MELDFLQQKLDERSKKGNLRALGDYSHLVDFVSNDYLGLSRNEQLSIQIAEKTFKNHVSNGGTGSRLLSGNHPYYISAEDYLKGLFNAESVLIFNSGYAANQALVSSVAEKGDTILYDQLAHVCLKEGAWLSRAETVAFRHNDLQDLESRLKRSMGRVFVLTETIFSMDGDYAPIKEMVELCEKHGAYLIVDEAHSTGVLGKSGSGLLVDLGLENRLFARVYTFGKAMGVHGACVAGSKTLTDYLVNFGRPFIYTTSLPPHSVISIEESFRFLSDNQYLQKELKDSINFFRSLWKSSLSETAIQPVMIGDNVKAREVSNTIQKEGFDVRPILSPTVQRGTERLRISLHVYNTEDEIARMVNCLKKEI